MLGSTFNSYLALATVFGTVISVPVNSNPPKTLSKFLFFSFLFCYFLFSLIEFATNFDISLELSKRGNAALDAANAAQSATTYLVCQLSYQTKAAAFSIG